MQSHLVIETLIEIVPGAEIVAMVAASDTEIPGFDLESWSAPGSERAFSHIRERVHDQLHEQKAVSSFSCSISNVAWGVLVEPIEIEGNTVIGALVVGRHGRAWSDRERALVKAFGGLLSHSTTLANRESVLLNQRKFDDFVSKVAKKLMSATSRTRQEVLDWTIRELAEFLSADVAFLRRNDHSRGVSVLVAEWSLREVPNPDPLAEVPFDADPVFEVTKDLREPYLPEPTSVPDDYLNHIEELSGEPRVTGAAVPMLRGETTWGVLGFLHFCFHAWIPEEVSALQAVASMLIQLQARIEAEERTEYIALHDDLTGLPNRRALLRELDNRLSSAYRKTAVLFLDLDRFKVMNDFLGHVSGDRVLTTVADRLRTSIRAVDFAARLGGDEFVVLVDGANSELELLSTAYRILKIVSRPIEFGGHQVSHTASVGIVMSKAGNRNGMELLGCADVALYSAKKQGRNQAVVFNEEIQESVSERSRTELTLREAVEEGQLCLHFQPEVDLRTDRMIAVEALVRWPHPTRGLLAASEFINVAEETGLVVEMGRQVLSDACRQLGAWRRDYPELPLVVRVNTSPAQYAMGGFVDFVDECLRVNGVPGDRLCVELTEHAVLQDPEQTGRILRDLQARGVEVAIDDFGTGYASMSVLKTLPANMLKLDMTFVQGVTTDPSDRAIVEATIRLGRALNMEVVAEGIESPATIDKLLELDCHRGQGYLISAPMPPEEITRILSTGALIPRSLATRPTASFVLPDPSL